MGIISTLSFPDSPTTPEPEWEGLLRGLLTLKGTAIILGATDSGKSTLARYLIQGLITENVKVSLVDSDVGQSSLGLPGTISMKAFRSKKDIEDFPDGTLIGLNHDEDTIALGIISEITSDSVTFESPIKSLKKINRVVFGDIKI